MAVPFTVVGIDHVVLRAADPTALERFYLDALGLRLERREGKLAQLRAGDALIDIVPADEAGPAVAHRAPAGSTSITCACGLSRSTGWRSPNIWPDKTSPAVRRLYH